MWFVSALPSASISGAAARGLYAPPTTWTATSPRRQSGVSRQPSLVDSLMRQNPRLAEARAIISLSRRLEGRSSDSRDVYGELHEPRSLSDAIGELLSRDPQQVEFRWDEAKVYYFVEGRRHHIVEDPAGGYFRVFDSLTSYWASPWQPEGEPLTQINTHFRSDEPVPPPPIDDATIALCQSILLAPQDGQVDSLNWVRIGAIQRCFPFLESRQPIQRALGIARASRDVSWIRPLTQWLGLKSERIHGRSSANLEVRAAEVAVAIDQIQSLTMTPSRLPLHALVDSQPPLRAEALASLVGVQLRTRDQALLALIAANATSAAVIHQYVRIALAQPSPIWMNQLARWSEEARSAWGYRGPTAAQTIIQGAAALATALERRDDSPSVARSMTRELLEASAD